MFRVFCVLLFLVQFASAEEVWVRGRPFKGAKTGSKSSIYVDGKALAEALEIPWERRGPFQYLGPAQGESEEASDPLSEVRVRDKSIPFQAGPAGEVMVELKATVGALGGTLTVNASLGTQDVFFSPSSRKELLTGQTASPPPVATTTSETTDSARKTGSARPVRDGGDVVRARKDPATGLWGLATVRGQWVVEPKFAGIGDFTEGLALASVSLGTKTDTKQKNRYTVVGSLDDLSAADKARYQAANKTERSKVAIPGKCGFIDKQGNWKIQPSYDFAENFHMDFSSGKRQYLAWVTRGKRRFLIDTEGNEVRLKPTKP